VPLLSSGTAAFPANGPLVAYSNDLTPAAQRTRGVPGMAAASGGKLCRGSVLVFGSSQMLEDRWLREEMNLPLVKCDRLPASDTPYIDHRHLAGLSGLLIDHVVGIMAAL
jgi:hypothetical protein